MGRFVSLSTTFRTTPRASASEIFTAPGVICPSASTFTGTVTTLPSFSTVTVPSVGAGTPGTTAWPSLPVVASCFFPSLSTMVTVAPSTLVPPSVTVTVTEATFLSSPIVAGVGFPSESTTSCTLASLYPSAPAFTPL